MPDRIEPVTHASKRRRSHGTGRRGRASDLKTLLTGASKPEGALGYHELQGFLFAVAAAPDLVPPSEWIPLVLGEKEPAFESGAHAQRVLGDLMTLYNEIVEDVNASTPRLPEPCRFRDDVLSNLADDAPVSQWCRGFAGGHSWLEESWRKAAPDALDDDLGALLMPMSFFVSRRIAEEFLAECTGGKRSLVEMAEICRNVFPDAMVGYAQLGRALRPVVTRPEPRHTESVGRNDPCPCGSGKKYKKCCHSAPADIMEQAARIVRRVQNDLEPRLVGFVRSLCGSDAIDGAWEKFAHGHPDLEPDGPEEQLFHPWLLYGWVPEIPGLTGRPDTRSIAERYLDEHASRLSPEEVAFLGTTCHTPTSFHDVLEVEPGRRLRLRDILLQTEHQVFERSASETLRVGDVIYGRVVAYDGVALIVGMGAIALPPIEKHGAIRIRERLRRDVGEPTPPMILAGDDELRGLYFGVRQRLMNPVPPVLDNMDGDPIEFHTITCDVESMEAAFKALAPLARGAAPDSVLRDAMADSGSGPKKIDLPWLKKATKKNSSGESTVLGHLVLEGTSLKAEVNSAARARRLERELRKRLGKTMRNLTVVIKPIAEALADYDRIRESPEERKRRAEEATWRARPEVREAMRQILERQWDGWLEEQVPALEGLTPREAVRQPAGREMVEALLLQFERGNVEDGESTYDFDRLRRKLGLPTRNPGPT